MRTNVKRLTVAAAVAAAIAGTSAFARVGDVQTNVAAAATASSLEEAARLAAKERTAERIAASIAASKKIEADRRAAAAAAAAKAAAARRAAEAARISRAKRLAADNSPAGAKNTGRTLAAERGWTGGQWDCLDTLWEHESNWRVSATNPSSGAYGIAQSLPAEKYATHGADWRTSAATQIRWGLDYIAASYGTPCDAWSFWQANHWY